MLDIRPYHASDLPRLYEICLKTGDSGKDATGQVDPELLGHFFAAPYVFHDPGLAFIATRNGDPVGYIVGTTDSRTFATWCETNWFPVLRTRYPIPAEADTTLTAAMIRAIHRGYEAEDLADDYPAHLHIDLLPAGQGTGLGRRLIDVFEAALKGRGVPALHFGVSGANKRAQGFYQHLGFETLMSGERGAIFGRRLDG